MGYVQKPFSSYKWKGAGAELGNASYAPQPSRYKGDNFSYTFKPFSTGTKNYRVLQIDGSKYLVTFSNWTYESESKFYGWQGRISERTETANGYTMTVLDVDGSQTAPTYGEYYGGAPLYVTANYNITLLQPGDAHYDEDPSSSSSNPGNYEEEGQAVWVIVKCDPVGVLTGSEGHSGGPCAYHEVITSYRDGTGVHYEYIGVNHNRSPGSFASAHKYAVDDTVRIGLHGKNLEVPYGEYNPPPKQWRFDRWDPSINGFNPVYTYSDGSCGFVLTQAIIDAYSVLASVARDQHDVYGIPDSDRVIILTAYLQPTQYATWKVEIAEGERHGTLRRISWQSSSGEMTTQFVTVVKDTPSEYEARVPSSYYPVTDKKVYHYLGYWEYSLFPDLDEGYHVYKYEVTRSDGGVDTYEGSFDVESYDDCEDLYYRTCYWVGGNRENATSVKFYIQSDHIGELLCTGAGKMLCNSSGQLLYAG